MEIKRDPSPLRRTAEECQEACARNPVWGAVFSDHMVTGIYTPREGWHDLRVSPLGTFSFPPSASVLNYGQAVFEGMKAYWQADGSIAAFRPQMNARRFAASAERMAMPAVPEDVFLDSLSALVEADRAWVPHDYGKSLYIRPIMFSDEFRLMTRPADNYRFVVFACPVADYFPSGIKPVTVWVSLNYVRAVRGGVGEAKFAGNYAAAFLAQKEAAKKGCDQVVWLDAIDRETIEEMGGMNIFFVLNKGRKKTLLTPKASGSLLKGVTRDTLLTLASDLGYDAEEGRITFDQWKAGCSDGSIAEVFACGTGAVITPIGKVMSDRGGFKVADGSTGEVTGSLRRALLDIQHGRSEDHHGWRYQLASPK
jgi:branched-chain amino acid aminotransferase